MTFEKVSPNRTPRSDPTLAIYPKSARSRLNAAATDRFVDTTHADLLTDADAERLAIVPRDDGAYLLHETSGGRQLSLAGAFADTWNADLNRLSETVRCPIEEAIIDGDAAIIVDVSAVLDALDDRDEGTLDDVDAAIEHDTATTQAEVDLPETVQSEGSTDERDEDRPLWRVAQDVDSIADLAAELDIDVNDARARAMDAGVYGELKDRPGDGSYGRDYGGTV